MLLNTENAKRSRYDKPTLFVQHTNLSIVPKYGENEREKKKCVFRKLRIMPSRSSPGLPAVWVTRQARIAKEGRKTNHKHSSFYLQKQHLIYTEMDDLLQVGPCNLNSLLNVIFYSIFVI